MDAKQNTYERIFVLGSGFSKSFLPKMPTLGDLNQLIPFGISEQFSHFRDYCIRLFELCNGQKEYLNIENLATSILSARIFPGERERLYHASLRFELLRFIASVIRHDEGLEEEAAGILRNFLRSCVNDDLQGRHTLLLSFNYDTLVERSIMKDPEFSEEISIDYGVRIDRADRSAKKSRNSRTIDLLKLHGSLNWFPIKGTTDVLDLKNVCQVEPEDRSFPIYCEDTPLYIPMAHAKESFLRGSLFNLLWSKADYYLKNAEKVYFIGYGFPKSDVNNLDFLLSHRKKIEKVVVFEPKDQLHLARLRDLLGKDLVINCDAKEFLKNFDFKC